jgi:hypothetical protein
MTYFKLNSILACSVSICMAATGPIPASRPIDDKKIGEKETLLPRTKTPLGKGIPEKIPAPTPEDRAPVKNDPPESPAGSDDKKDCDECVLVGAPAGESLRGPLAFERPASGGGMPIVLANTLWGLFCVGRPRWFPRTRIKGLIFL